MAKVSFLAEYITQNYPHFDPQCTIDYTELTVEVPQQHLLKFCEALRDDQDCLFDMLIDVCGVDYKDYGIGQWETESATSGGFGRGVENQSDIENPSDIEEVAINPWHKPRFAVVYHLLSIQHNHRIRLRSFVDEQAPIIDSVVAIWPAADWFEREAFDLYGILFNGHPDLRRILTDYGFIGHPFRKDFPLSGNVEVRYDATQERVVYEPVDIEPRVLVPKVIRADNRYVRVDDDAGGEK